MNIDDLIKDVVIKEGGFVNDKADRGGATKYGITIATLSEYLGRPATVEEVKNLSVSVAAEIYKKKYFYSHKIDKLPDLIQPIIFDIGVNSGPKKAISMLQEVLTTLGYNLGKIDGVIGNNTITVSKFASSALGSDLVNAIVARRIKFYRSIVERDPTQRRFLNGWLSRANSFLEK